MKIIHTSDWHLGQVFNDYERILEHENFFRKLSEIIRQERPDALLVSGDIYHNSVPSVSVQRFYTDKILELREACSTMTIIVTAGNHDSPSRLEIDRNLWERIGVRVTGGLQRSAGKLELDRHIIEISSADGSPAGYVIALPHIYRQNYPHVSEYGGATDGETGGETDWKKDERYSGETSRKMSGKTGRGTGEEMGNRTEGRSGVETDGETSGKTGSEINDAAELRQQKFYKALMERVKKINIGQLPVVIMAHLAVSGCDISGHQEPIGGMEYTPQDIFPDGYDYLALGHIHHPQTLGRNQSGDKAIYSQSVTYDQPVARYSGSPVPVSFDEDYPHSVSVVEIQRERQDNGEYRRAIKLREAEIPSLIPMITIPEKPVPFELALEELQNFPADKEAYVRLNVQITDYLPQRASEQAIKAAKGKKCRYCYIKVTRNAVENVEKLPDFTVEEMREISPSEVAMLHYRQKYGEDMDEGMKEMLEGVIKTIKEEKGKD